MGILAWKLHFHADFYEVYTLWRHPGLLPLVHAPDIVLNKMRGGADLMTPGLARGPPFPATATKGSPVAVASLEKPTVPLVVGVCEIDISSLSDVQGLKGHAVRSLHWEGDKIWEWNQAGKPGGSAPPHIEGWASFLESETGDLETAVTKMALHGSSSINVDDLKTNGKQAENPCVDCEEDNPYEGVSTSQTEMSIQGARPGQQPKHCCMN